MLLLTGSLASCRCCESPPPSSLCEASDDVPAHPVEAQRQQAAQRPERPDLAPRVEHVDGRVVRPYYGEARQRGQAVGADGEAGAAVGHRAVGAARFLLGGRAGVIVRVSVRVIVRVSSIPSFPAGRGDAPAAASTAARRYPLILLTVTDGVVGSIIRGSLLPEERGLVVVHCSAFDCPPLEDELVCS